MTLCKFRWYFNEFGIFGVSLFCRGTGILNRQKCSGFIHRAESFFNRTGLLAFLFFFLETGRIIRGYTKGQKMMQVIVTDGFNEALTGTCIYFLKSTTDEITLKNVDKV